MRILTVIEMLLLGAVHLLAMPGAIHAAESKVEAVIPSVEQKSAPDYTSRVLQFRFADTQEAFMPPRLRRMARGD